ncbi:hypothetical protein VTK73DRAFT_6156 [Phialemonium thermophilum]|uniref:Secreted protein n=1 Tax=Phialemonium thermophilum TaxID=223376 RepID=A0ABR3V066_9PEZI
MSMSSSSESDDCSTTGARARFGGREMRTAGTLSAVLVFLLLAVSDDSVAWSDRSCLRSPLPSLAPPRLPGRPPPPPFSLDSRLGVLVSRDDSCCGCGCGCGCGFTSRSTDTRADWVPLSNLSGTSLAELSWIPLAGASAAATPAAALWNPALGSLLLGRRSRSPW